LSRRRKSTGTWPSNSWRRGKGGPGSQKKKGALLPLGFKRGSGGVEERKMKGTREASEAVGRFFFTPAMGKKAGGAYEQEFAQNKGIRKKILLEEGNPGRGVKKRIIEGGGRREDDCGRARSQSNRWRKGGGGVEMILIQGRNTNTKARPGLQERGALSREPREYLRQSRRRKKKGEGCGAA